MKDFINISNKPGVWTFQFMSIISFLSYFYFITVIVFSSAVAH